MDEDLPISGLPTATLPLNGTEPTVVVQGGVTKQVPNGQLSKVVLTESKLTVETGQVTVPAGFIIGIFYNGFRLEDTVGYNKSGLIVTFTGNPAVDNGETVIVITAQ